MTSACPLLEIRDVCKSFSGKNIVAGISFSVNKGDFFGIIGPNGAGKSTLINMLVTLTKRTSGTINFSGTDVSDKQDYFRSKIGYVPQDLCLYPDMTVYENMHYFAMMYGCDKEKARRMIDDLLFLVDLQNSRDVPSKNLSGGMQRRLNIACSLVHDPELVILDEPTANLDHHQKEEIWKLLKSINRLGTTIITSSHLLHDMNLLCNRIVFIAKGSVIFEGTPKDLQGRFNQNLIVRLMTEPGDYGRIVSTLMPHLIINNYAVRNNVLSMNVTNTNYAMHEMVAMLDKIGEYIVDIEIEKPSLDNTFEEIIRRFE